MQSSRFEFFTKPNAECFCEIALRTSVTVFKAFLRASFDTCLNKPLLASLLANGLHFTIYANLGDTFWTELALWQVESLRTTLVEFRHERLGHFSPGKEARGECPLFRVTERKSSFEHLFWQSATTRAKLSRCRWSVQIGILQMNLVRRRIYH